MLLLCVCDMLRAVKELAKTKTDCWIDCRTKLCGKFPHSEPETYFHQGTCGYSTRINPLTGTGFSVGLVVALTCSPSH
ncbi:hypothetical protein RRG08_006027 [Elysia crispata]|uniref:Uncharacterized protein n=1 Tax=Elysia crispata TaxID=231223 RepID=A0AAE1DZ15_9GAST|nr:hypothetical protein RRG08_006027 [Elysia crispata]